MFRENGFWTGFLINSFFNFVDRMMPLSAHDEKAITWQKSCDNLQWWRLNNLIKMACDGQWWQVFPVALSMWAMFSTLVKLRLQWRRPSGELKIIISMIVCWDCDYEEDSVIRNVVASTQFPSPYRNYHCIWPLNRKSSLHYDSRWNDDFLPRANPDDNEAMTTFQKLRLQLRRLFAMPRI